MIHGERQGFLRKFYDLIRDWEGQPPDLREILRPEEIDWLLVENMKNHSDDNSFFRRMSLIAFVVRTGYKDEPQLDKDGRPLSRRTTPIHLAARKHLVAFISELFKIYDRFDVNYIDASGLTHFHVACVSGCDDVVEKFLQHGASPNCLWPSTGDSLLNWALKHHKKGLARLLLLNGADPNFANADGSTTLHVISSYACFSEEWVNLLHLIFYNNQTLQVDARDKNGKTPLQLALRRGNMEVAKWLLRRGADFNLADTDGFTPLHTIISLGRSDEWARLFIRIKDKQHRVLQVDALDKEGNTALHLALRNRRNRVASALLRRGANPNLISGDGSTALHIICEKNNDDVAWVNSFFKICDEMHRTVHIDAQNNLGQTPLQLALTDECWTIAELLLSRGANPNSVSGDGSTALHIICEKCNDCDFDWVVLFFEICDENNQTVRIDAKDRLGRTPLQLALTNGRRTIAETLLRRGSDPNLADPEGSTPLHIICQVIRYDKDEFVKVFFEINRERNQVVRVDARDILGQTPLQWAVSNLMPNTVDFLLNNGADLSSFVFPDENYFGIIYKLKGVNRYRSVLKLELMSGALMIVESLEKKGYDVNRSDALKIVKFFKLMEQSDVNLEKNWLYESSSFARVAKKTMINSSLSLYDLIRLRPEEAAKRVAAKDCFVARSQNIWPPLFHREENDLFFHLRERVSRGFFRNWALVSFMELTRYNLPFECCELIIDGSFTNKELCNICLAADKGHEESEKKINYLKKCNNKRQRIC
ncbi:unnamed protein product [Trichogramma brassicae]|uniref:Uncharacterized protein n=1 Tax=Trichogramma brassicae TaxID=86971 RepID=A0A6H5HYE9_9HYME|nr:unnamed protein product [Trichogramma brassicae]